LNHPLYHRITIHTTVYVLIHTQLGICFLAACFARKQFIFGPSGVV